MALKIKLREREGVTIVDLNGRVVLGDGASELSDAVKGLLDQGKKKLLINLAGVTKMDSTGLGSLVGSYASATRQSAKLKLLKPQERIENLLIITKLITVFETFDDEDEAIASFAGEVAMKSSVTTG